MTIDTRYRDAALPTSQRVEILLGQMTLEEKAGLFFQNMIAMGDGGALAGESPEFSLPSTEEYVLGRHMTHFNLFGAAPDARTIAEWQNRLQDLAASTRLGIPVTLSTDPRHSFTDNPGTAMHAGPFSQWPEPLGLGAVGDSDMALCFGDTIRQEYTAVGLRVALHPQIDLATEPRWARQVGTFGQDADLTTRLGVAYIRGLQGPALGTESVAAMVKHFPGGGPQKDGEDPHFAYGREQVYPGDNFDYHLKPFEAVIDAGASQMMPYYGMPVGTDYEEVGFGFNKSVITALLRERYGFDGIVCTDWGLITDSVIAGDPFPARAWGVEHLSPAKRMVKALEAGADQFGGEADPSLLVELVRSGAVSEERLDVSARRLLREKFVLGLFDDPYVDAARAEKIVGSAGFRAAGNAAQRASITVLANRAPAGGATLPLSRGVRIYAEGFRPGDLAAYGVRVEAPEDADVAILRVAAPFEKRSTAFENFFHAGSLEFPADEAARILRIARIVPTVVDVFLDRPAILTPFVEDAAAIVANFGASGEALLDVLFGAVPPRGHLPIELPSSMAAVEASRPDVPSDTADPLFPFGHGLTY
ncbi:glycoside hydrolase family 3 N-terminal domain-containing protein [Sinomonas sp. ASV322]|uniref:glycoside hydrolase family 3 protein n=1 Tax=Sinomonas sp. ASV322 TaxID=3041920 RepID=UPI0027DBC427|nr:glycoside hydrolase family 3 N-terminal domain-containing protein [Sinomonas sp. ASV322]MDQ4501614.1 glycoside hydrolase family 3 N-terminal domain-containing protein [Sinomonas sp. ASV322]